MNAADRQLLLQVVYDRAGRGTLVRLSWFIGFLGLVQLISKHFNQPAFGEVPLLFLSSCLAYLWCGAFVKNAIQQNSPSNAVLVPGLRRRLMRMTVYFYVAATLLTGVLSWLLLDRPSYGLLLGAVFSVYVLYAQRHSGLNFLPVAVIIASTWVSRHPVDELLAAVDRIGELPITVIGLLLLALMGWHAVHMLFLHGGDRHWAWHHRHIRQLARANGRTVNTAPGCGLRWLAWLRTPYNLALRADSRRGAGRGRQMLHSLGLPAYDGGAIGYALVSAVVMALVGRYVASKGDVVVTMICSTMMQGMLMMSVLIYAATVASQAVRYGGEQGLFRLSPAAPATGQFNRVLLGTLLFRCLRLWLISAVAAIAIDAAVLGQFELRGITYALAMLMLPFSVMLLRDYASAAAQPNTVLTVATTTLVVLAYIALAGLDQKYPGLPLFWLGSIVWAATAVTLVLRWRRWGAAPVLLPAGRLAA
ncbi:hypothetical protein GTP45_08945 [Pseudoduganella sp. FT55W]|uniref:Uncharacterized protein n=1 Tax=Duganella rivi TaxID=2666083 RepID=A0A7X4KBG5_9BURK|nr:hypothetical protein [Duganella rivi]MYM66952.1 hypothetical protein [Duganella rivi]